MAVGLGAARDDGGFYRVGEPLDLKTRAERLDEDLQVLTGLWGGAPFSFHGRHYQVDALTLLPVPVQQPRAERLHCRAPAQRRAVRFNCRG